MSSLKRLSQVFKSAERLSFYDSSKIILMSDCHRGDGSYADEFLKNENIYISALNHYYNTGYTYIEIGDGDELWENKRLSDIINAHPNVFQLLRKFYLGKRLYFIYGNHDMVKRNRRFAEENLYKYYDKPAKKELPLFENIQVMEGLVLVYQGSVNQQEGNEIFLIHGHQVDFLNSDLWKFARFLVRYVWKPLELFAINNPTSPAQNQEKKERIGRRLTDWVIRENQMLIAGHNHRPMFPEIGEPLYFNDGSSVNPLFITGIEINRGEITLVKWGVKVNENGLLFVGRDLIAGPVKLKDFFNAERIYESCSLKDPTDTKGGVFV
ncbi:MAG: metallophosphoesterase family protein [Eubacteriales bacterium]|nr:metallophosphoesterase family protein [Eubacteriales bacterium]